ncbi:MAG: DNA adenine methylase, partial [candidate division WOR-3 bacterium]
MIEKLMKLVPPGGLPYCEPYCGGASLFFAREPAPVEVLNDINGDIVNLFRCLQDKKTFEELRHKIMYIPYAREEFERAVEIYNSDSQNVDNVTRALAFFIVQNQGFAGNTNKVRFGDWGRVFCSTRNIAETTNRWIMRLSMLDAFHWRLMMAQIDNIDAIECIKYWDTQNTVFYIDPPYHQDTRKRKNAYKFEASEEHLKALVEVLLNVKGSVTLSGYNHEIYLPLEYAGWKRIDFRTVSHAAGKVRKSNLRGEDSAIENVPRIESVWINP